MTNNRRGSKKPGSRGAKSGPKSPTSGARSGARPGAGPKSSSSGARSRGKDAAKPAGRSGGGSGKPRRGGKSSAGQRGTTPIRPHTGSKRRPLGGDHVEGRQAVRELLLAGTRRAREVILAADMDDAAILEEIVELANEDLIPIRELSRSKFDAMARTESSQGVMATAPPLLEYELAELARPKGSTPPFLLIVDGVTDPGNLGSLLRIAECAGVTGVVLPRHRAAHITPTVTKTAAGAIEHLRIGQVTGTPTAISQLKEMEIWTVGLDMVSDTSIFDLRVATDPVALVLGAEGAGLSRLTRDRCDVVANIPLTGSIGSLNVAAAGAVACFEVVRRRAEAQE